MRQAVERELGAARLPLHPDKSRIYRCADGVTRVLYSGDGVEQSGGNWPRGSVKRSGAKAQRLCSSGSRSVLQSRTGDVQSAFIRVYQRSFSYSVEIFSAGRATKYRTLINADERRFVDSLTERVLGALLVFVGSPGEVFLRTEGVFAAAVFTPVF